MHRDGGAGLFHKALLWDGYAPHRVLRPAGGTASACWKPLRGPIEAPTHLPLEERCRGICRVPTSSLPPSGGGRWHGEAVTDEGASFHRAGLSHRICQGGSAPQGGIHLGTPCRRSRAGQARPCTKTENIPKGRLPAARKAFPPLGGRWHGEAVTDEGASFHCPRLSHDLSGGFRPAGRNPFGDTLPLMPGGPSPPLRRARAP